MDHNLATDHSPWQVVSTLQSYKNSFLLCWFSPDNYCEKDYSFFIIQFYVPFKVSSARMKPVKTGGH